MTRRVLVTILWMGAGLRAQAPSKFEVASVKPNVSGGGAQMVRTPGGLTATNTEFSSLVEMAFETRLIDLSQVPDSLRSQRFDVAAKSTGKISGDQYWEMLRALLVDRFKLTFHRDAKEAQVYVLTVAKNGTKKGTEQGPKLSRSIDAECPVNPSGTNFCGVSPRPGMIIGQRVSMARIARELSPFAGRPVQDETGLTGSFDFQLKWRPDPGESRGDLEKLKAAGIPFDPSGPSFSAAIQEQLGLKLESKKRRIEILVVDHAEPPSQN